MLTEICQYLRNWFNRKPNGDDYPKFSGEFVIEDNELKFDGLVNGQYYRIMGSLFNDGVHKYGENDLTDETFTGVIWSMGVPKEVVQLAEEISEWQTKYGGVDGSMMSPFNSESFGGYSYNKSGGGASSGVQSAGSGTWQGAFASRLNMWRKI